MQILSPSSRAMRALVAAAAVFLAACGTDSNEPQQALTFAVELDSPNGDEGAALLELEGDVAVVRAPAGTRIMMHRDGGATRVVVVRDEPGSIAFEVDLAEPGPAPEARVIEVSGPDDALRAVSSGYAVSFRARR